MKVLLASFEPRRDQTLAGWRFVRKPTRHASSRQFESQPTKIPGRYEHTPNAHPDPTIRQFGARRGVPRVALLGAWLARPPEVVRVEGLVVQRDDLVLL
jgi:hypothetical protein